MGVLASVSVRPRRWQISRAWVCRHRLDLGAERLSSSRSIDTVFRIQTVRLHCERVNGELFRHRQLGAPVSWIQKVR